MVEEQPTFANYHLRAYSSSQGRFLGAACHVGMRNLMKWVRRIGYEAEDSFPGAAEESEGTAALSATKSDMRP